MHSKISVKYIDLKKITNEHCIAAYEHGVIDKEARINNVFVKRPSSGGAQLPYASHSMLTSLLHQLPRPLISLCSFLFYAVIISKKRGNKLLFSFHKYNKASTRIFLAQNNYSKVSGMIS